MKMNTSYLLWIVVAACLMSLQCFYEVNALEPGTIRAERWACMACMSWCRAKNCATGYCGSDTKCRCSRCSSGGSANKWCSTSAGKCSPAENLYSIGFDIFDWKFDDNGIAFMYDMLSICRCCPFLPSLFNYSLYWLFTMHSLYDYSFFWLFTNDSLTIHYTECTFKSHRLNFKCLFNNINLVNCFEV